MIPIHFYNTLSAAKELFQPQVPGKVSMYVCGITPYDESHLGHARCYVFFDVVKRLFKESGLEVTCIQNFTDIDDKIIARAKDLKEDPKKCADRFIEDYFQKMDLLNVKRATFYPRVTEVIPEIIQFIQKLLGLGLAYPLDGDIYYSVRNFKGYGKLSKRTLDEMESGARVEVDERKQDPFDFALWKKAKEGEPFWDSPWGGGRPGWHIECSVMAMKHLGETFDIHGGGQDLIFPHHENEIAQSEGLTKKIFARAWLHNGFVTVNREKMSKSLGNFFTLREIFEKFKPEVVRFFLLSRHYRTPLDFSDELLQQSANAYQSLKEAEEISFFLLEEEPKEHLILEDKKKFFLDALSDDFNTEKAIAELFKLRNEMVEAFKKRDLAWIAKARNTLYHCSVELLGVSLKSDLTLPLIGELKQKLKERELARKNKDWARADILRNEILMKGRVIEDTPSGPIIKSKG
ncbi:MAG: cysteine--tRNA ligase [Elusimicrobia bacterium RIFCSPLOWO2_02_FULL_39_32]|nr:MAG: cysteine--tRNA ligase [Elusimicrobia bacterium RIFCSPHIGHO2_02_FULL_39_36]OGR91178.1 MAG: cysteine--tRNA ligase [Elusimicrobia bacterium RIFCSPLOWO2_02_FULL_39_32]OGS00146.1 MAG: cysteine--tRNA ligase [Elusimicrobia bacterium RIFCSPLOWO2_12_FULL_39_28]